MNVFWKKPKVEFLCLVDGAQAAYPITPMRQYKPDWLLATAKEAAEKAKRTDLHPRNTRSIAKCPGIRAALNTGWVVFNWQDITIDILDKEQYQWTSAIDQTLHPTQFPYISHHPTHSFKHSEFLSQQTPIIRIHAPWIVKIPDGYTLFMKNFPYQETDAYTVAEGLCIPEYRYYEATVPLMFHKPGQYFIKAGTPLAQLLLIKNEQFDAEYRVATPAELSQLRAEKVVKNSTWISNYREMKEKLKRLGDRQ